MAGDAATLAREAIEAYNDEGVEGFLRYIHPDFEGFVPPEVSLEPDTYRGHDGVRRYFDSWAEGVEDLTFHIHEIRVGPHDAAYVDAHVRGRGLESGLEADLQAHAVMHIRDGLITRWAAYPTPDDALAAAGIEDR